MSRDEISRLVEDVMGNPVMMQEAMAIQDQSAMETYIADKGYDLTKDEMLEVWNLAAKVLAGHNMPMAEAEAQIKTVKTEAMAAKK